MKLMLAGKAPEDLDKLSYPVMASPKLDGIRAFVDGDKLWSRNNKLIPSKFLQKVLGNPSMNGLDGELICGEPTSPSVFRDTTSAVMSEDGGGCVVFYVFDNFNTPGGFQNRFQNLLHYKFDGLYVVVVEHRVINSAMELDQYEHECLAAGFEGVMIRSLNGPYKEGRSTEREGYLLKLKRFADAEATITGFEEKLHNGNEKDASGKRTAHKAGKSGLGTLGALKVVGKNGPYRGVAFNIGTGFDDAERAKIWAARSRYIGQTVTYKYFPSGSKDAPRFPVFLRFRYDMS